MSKKQGLWKLLTGPLQKKGKKKSGKKELYKKIPLFYMYWIAKGDYTDHIYNECCSQSFSVLDSYVLHGYKSRASDISGGRLTSGNLCFPINVKHIDWFIAGFLIFRFYLSCFCILGCFRGFQVFPGINQGYSRVFWGCSMGVPGLCKVLQIPHQKRDFNVAYVHGNYTAVAYLSHQLRRDLSFRNFLYVNYKN